MGNWDQAASREQDWKTGQGPATPDQGRKRGPAGPPACRRPGRRRQQPPHRRGPRGEQRKRDHCDWFGRFSWRDSFEKRLVWGENRADSDKNRGVSQENRVVRDRNRVVSGKSRAVEVKNREVPGGIDPRSSRSRQPPGVASHIPPRSPSLDHCPIPARGGHVKPEIRQIARRPPSPRWGSDVLARSGGCAATKDVAAPPPAKHPRPLRGEQRGNAPGRLGFRALRGEQSGRL